MSHNDLFEFPNNWITNHLTSTEEILTSCVTQSENAVKKSEHRREWQNLLDLSESLLDFHNHDPDFEYISNFMNPFAQAFLIGHIAGILSAPDRLDHELTRLEAAKLKYSQAQREAPLKLKKMMRDAAIKKAQELALEEWNGSENADLRLGEMCELIWGKTLTGRYFSPNELPDRPIGLKPWLRPVAPERASRRGRPKNK